MVIRSPLPHKKVKRMSRFYVPFLAIIAALFPSIVWAGTIAVDGTNCTLSEAVGVANNDLSANGCVLIGGYVGDVDTLYLAEGIHSIDGATLYDEQGKNGAPQITSELTVVGQGEGSTVTRTGSEEYRLFYVTVTGTLTISNVSVTNFHTSLTGGAIYNLGNLTLNNSSLISNTAQLGGGGIANTQNATAQIINSNLVGNRSNSTSGAILNYTGSLTLINTSILSNTSNSGGGGIVNLFNSTATILNSRIIANRVNGNTGGGEGGGIVNGFESTLVVSDTQIIDNYARTNGGGIITYNATLTVTNSSLISNTAGDNGGAIYSQWSKTAISNSSIVNNSHTAIQNYDNSNTVQAPNNWWGAEDGPSGSGPGTGDSVSDSINVDNFKTSETPKGNIFLPSLSKVPVSSH